MKNRLKLATLLAGFIALFILGCGGGGGGAASSEQTTGGTQLTGNAAVRAAAVSSYQSVAAGIGYPVQALLASAPSGSKVPLGVGSSLRSVLTVAKQMRATKRTPARQPRLHSRVSTSTATMACLTVPPTPITFYTDSAGAKFGRHPRYHHPGR